MPYSVQKARTLGAMITIFGISCIGCAGPADLFRIAMRVDPFVMPFAYLFGVLVGNGPV